MNRIWLIAEHDAQQLVRDRWFAGMVVAFALLTLAVAVVGGSGPQILRVSPFERTVTALAVLSALFIPLLGLTLGAGWIAGQREQGVLTYLLAQPVSREALFFGHVVGLSLATVSATLVGFGAAGVLLALQGGGSVPAYLALCALAALLGLACLWVGLGISAVAGNRTRALGAALVAWLFFVIVADLLLLGAATVWRPGPGVLLALLALSPAGLFRLGVLVGVTGSGDLAGPAAMLAVARLGPDGAVALAMGALALWAVAGGGLGYWWFGRQVEP